MGCLGLAQSSGHASVNIVVLLRVIH